MMDGIIVNSYEVHIHKYEPSNGGMLGACIIVRRHRADGNVSIVVPEWDETETEFAELDRDDADYTALPMLIPQFDSVEFEHFSIARSGEGRIHTSLEIRAILIEVLKKDVYDYMDSHGISRDPGAFIEAAMDSDDSITVSGIEGNFNNDCTENIVNFSVVSGGEMKVTFSSDGHAAPIIFSLGEIQARRDEIPDFVLRSLDERSGFHISTLNFSRCGPTHVHEPILAFSMIHPDSFCHNAGRDFVNRYLDEAMFGTGVELTKSAMI